MTTLETDNARLEQEVQTLQAKLDDLSQAIVSLEPEKEVEKALEELAEVESETPKEAGSDRMMRSISKMMDNPAMNKMMVASQRGTLDVMYADLVDQLNLNGKEKTHFMDLLLSRHMGMVDLSMKIMGGNLSQEEQDALKADLKEKGKLMKEEMAYFLNNPDDVAEWKFYEKTIAERMMLSQVEQSLAESDAAFSDETYRQLLEAMHEEKSGFDFSSDLNDSENMDMSSIRFSAENIKNYANDLEALDRSVADRARLILTPEQLDVFLKSQKDNRDMQIAQLEMAAQMFGKNR